MATKTKGFTLIELLVVISIIALLVGILLPALGAARKTAQRVQCASRLRQVTISLTNYATDNKGLYPPNFSGSPGIGQPVQNFYWFDVERIGQYLPGIQEQGTGSIGGGVLACPVDENAARTYVVNLHSSSDKIERDPDIYFTYNTVKRTTNMLLATEGWAYNDDGESFFADSEAGGFPTPFMPATWFGLGGSVNKGALKALFGDGVKSTIRYNLHSDAGNEEFDGAVNMAYVDGHVENKRTEDLVNTATGKSTYDTLWSEIDEKVESGP